jgi:hypothetical protein
MYGTNRKLSPYFAARRSLERNRIWKQRFRSLSVSALLITSGATGAILAFGSTQPPSSWIAEWREPHAPLNRQSKGSQIILRTLHP